MNFKTVLSFHWRRKQIENGGGGKSPSLPAPGSDAYKADIFNTLQLKLAYSILLS